MAGNAYLTSCRVLPRSRRPTSARCRRRGTCHKFQLHRQTQRLKAPATSAFSMSANRVGPRRRHHPHQARQTRARVRPQPADTDPARMGRTNWHQVPHPVPPDHPAQGELRGRACPRTGRAAADAPGDRVRGNETPVPVGRGRTRELQRHHPAQTPAPGVRTRTGDHPGTGQPHRPGHRCAGVRVRGPDGPGRLGAPHPHPLGRAAAVDGPPRPHPGSTPALVRLDTPPAP